MCAEARHDAFTLFRSKRREYSICGAVRVFECERLGVEQNADGAIEGGFQAMFDA